MNLLNEQIQKKVKERSGIKAAPEIATAQKHHRRLRFHVDTALDNATHQTAYREFMGWVRAILPDDKANRFEQLFNWPIPTNELTSSIFSELSRVFSAQDYTEAVTLSDKDRGGDFADYRQKRLKDQYWIKNEGWQLVKTGIDSVIVVDLPAEQKSAKPEPFFYHVNPEQFVDLKVSAENRMEYFIFRNGDRLIALDDTFYRVYGFKDGKLSAFPEIEAPHGLNYCPARCFWSDPIATGNTVNKRSPLSGVLSELDWFLFHKISKRYLDLYASYPIYASYEQDAEPENEGSDDKPTAERGQVKQAGGDMMGPGSYFTVPPPMSREDADLNVNPIQVIGAERTSLDYNVEESERLPRNIFRSCVGYDGDPVNDEVMNEMQIQGTFESRESILVRLSENLAAIQAWILHTAAALRYGPEYVTGVQISYGRKFYLQDEMELVGAY